MISSLAVGPYITEFIVPRTVARGGPGLLVCEASGFPVPAVTWYHNGSLTASDGDRVMIITRVTGRLVASTLAISMAMSINSGNYTCVVASPGYGDVARSAVAVVQGT